MLYEDSTGVAPTNSVGTGVETSLPPAVEPPGIPRGSKIIRRRKKRKVYESTNTYAFQVSLKSLGDIVVYCKSESEAKQKVNKYLKDPKEIINIKRLFPAQVVDFYTKKRTKAVKRIADLVLEGSNMNQTAIPSPMPLANPQQDNAAKEKQIRIKNQQQAHKDAHKRMQLLKQNAAKQLQLRKAEMQKRIQNSQQAMKQRSLSGSLDNQQI